MPNASRPTAAATAIFPSGVCKRGSIYPGEMKNNTSEIKGGTRVKIIPENLDWEVCAFNCPSILNLSRIVTESQSKTFARFPPTSL